MFPSVPSADQLRNNALQKVILKLFWNVTIYQNGSVITFLGILQPEKKSNIHFANGGNYKPLNEIWPHRFKIEKKKNRIVCN